MPTSKLSLHGLIRHMAEVERNWFRRVLAGDDIGFIWVDPTRDDSELEPPRRCRVGDGLERLEAQNANAVADLAAKKALDDTGLRRGQPCSLRWIYNHMIEEYARHNGHADLIRVL